MKIKYIFLDIDGVITTPSSGYCLDPDKMMLLGKLLGNTNSWLVISSSWRAADVPDTILNLTDYDNEYVRDYPFRFANRIVGITPRLNGTRGDEIIAYLKEKPCDTYIIIDDECDFLPEQMPFLIHTNGDVGLTENDVKAGIEILNRIDGENQD